MKDFEYIRARSVDHALEVLAEKGESAVKIAGGQSLLNILKQGLMAPDCLVDIKGLEELDFIESNPGTGFRIGALTTHASILDSEVLQSSCGVLASMERHLATVQVRNWGTIGGNLCMADPSSDAAPVLIALGSTAHIRGPEGAREVPLGEFFLGYYETVVQPGELLTEISFPAIPPATGVSYEKFRNVEGDAPIVVSSAFVSLEKDGRTLSDARVVLGGVASTPVRATAVEDALKGVKLTPAAVESASGLVAESTSPIPDVVCSAEYRNKIARVLAKRTLLSAFEEAKAAVGGKKHR